MKIFFKVCLISFLVQALFILFFLLDRTGDGVIYFVYGIPYAFLGSIVQSPKQVGTGVVSLFLLLCAPAALYCAIIAIVVFLFRRSALTGTS